MEKHLFKIAFRISMYGHTLLLYESWVLQNKADSFSKAALLLIAEIHSTHKVANQQCREEARVYEQTKPTKPQY